MEEQLSAAKAMENKTNLQWEYSPKASFHPKFYEKGKSPESAWRVFV